MKKLIVLFTLLLTFSLVSTASAQKIQTGKFTANYKSDGYTLNKGEGRRTFSVEVRFEKPFETTPEIILNLTHVNVETKDGMRVRYEVEAKGVSRDGFILEMATWDNSQVHELRGSWLAYTN